jgi:hypothetical protein
MIVLCGVKQIHESKSCKYFGNPSKITLLYNFSRNDVEENTLVEKLVNVRFASRKSRFKVPFSRKVGDKDNQH